MKVVLVLASAFVFCWALLASDLSRGFAFIAVGIAIYLLPSFVANGRHKRNAGAIFVLNLLLGWTLLGWVGALVWSLTEDQPQPASVA